MDTLQDYENLTALARKALGKFRKPCFLCLGIFFLGFVTLMFDWFPFVLTLLMLAAIFPALVYAVLWPIAASRTRKQAAAFTQQQLRAMDAEIPNKPIQDGLLVTSQAVIGTQLGLQLVPMVNVLWVYNSVSTVKYNGLIPVHKDTTLMFAGRDRRQVGFRVKNKGNALEFVRDEILRYRQDVVFGYEHGMDDIYKNDIGRLVAFANECAEKRQKGTV